VGRRWVGARETDGNMRVRLNEAGWKRVDWIHLAVDRDNWRAVVNTVMNLRVE
jgi:hypothetical protein